MYPHDVDVTRYLSKAIFFERQAIKNNYFVLPLHICFNCHSCNLEQTMKRSTYIIALKFCINFLITMG